ncbi:MAG: antitoxin [Actinomycetes bacterium]
MSARLQVVLDDSEFDEIRAIAASEGTTVSEWVRRSLREARRSTAAGKVDTKLAAVRAAAQHSFPAPDIEQMLREVERGYLE